MYALFAVGVNSNFRIRYNTMLPANILFSDRPSEDLSKLLVQKHYSKTVVLVDENTRKFCLPLLFDDLSSLHVIEVSSGEEHKNLDTCQRIWSKMTELALDRHAIMVVVGGGVLGDMGGFCAATYKRGIDFVLIPTTLLAQVDASIGGKLGIDFQSFKNHIGVFQQPILTLLHTGFLKTLPLAELRSGFAEVIKHCLISDPKMWKEISTKSLEDLAWKDLVEHSVVFKALVTSEDPKEKGLRKILNAGHTIGHAVESYLLEAGRRILHGEAIAIGLIAEGYIAAEKGLLAKKDFHEITSYIIKIYGKILLKDDDVRESSGLAVQDKKNRDNRILCVLLNGIGNAKWDEEITVDQIRESLHYYQKL
jgi:3-dehydroquinate synthase